MNNFDLTIHLTFFFCTAGIPSLSATTTLSVNIINSNDKDPYFIPATQRAEVREDAKIGTRILQLQAHDPDIVSTDALAFEALEPITAVNKNGKEVTDNASFKNLFAVDRFGNVTVNGPLDRDFFAVVRLTIVVTDTTAPTLQQGKGLLVITIIEVNELPPVRQTYLFVAFCVHRNLRQFHFYREKKIIPKCHLCHRIHSSTTPSALAIVNNISMESFVQFAGGKKKISRGKKKEMRKSFLVVLLIHAKT